MSELLERLLKHNNAQLNKQMRRLEKIRDRIIEDRGSMDSENSVSEANQKLFKIDQQINMLRFNLDAKNIK